MRFPDVPLSRLFEPRSIAVAGASADPGKAGHQMMRSLQGFPGAVWAVNREGVSVAGKPGFKRLTDIPQPPDLAILVIPPQATVEAIEQCGQAGIHAAVLCSGGFAEAGDEGRRLQRLMVDVADRHHIWLLGPNTSGFANPPRRVFASFVPGIGQARPGKVAVVAQSGGVNHALGFLGTNDRLGFSKLIGLGNSANLDFPDVLAYLADDPETAVVVLHIEGLRQGRATIEAIHGLTGRKAVVAYKVGRSDVREFARSHTGALTGDQALTVAALRQAGAVVVDSATAAIDAAKALAMRRLPPGAHAAAVVTGQAGPGIIVADVLRSAGVSVPPLGDLTLKRISELLPPITFIRNPVDTGRPGPALLPVLEAVAADPNVGLLVLYQVLEPAVDLPAMLSALAMATQKPALLATGGPAAELETACAAVEQCGIPCFPAPERVAGAAVALVQDALARSRPAAFGAGIEGPGTASAARESAVAAGRLAARARGEGRRALYEDEAKQLLAVLGFIPPAGFRVSSHGDAAAMAAWLGYPVVAKLMAPNLTHKSEAGAVKVHLKDEAELDAALAELDVVANRLGTPPAYLVERYLPGAELVLGARRDPSFGPVVLVASGGTLTELRPDASLRLAPVSANEALEMLAELAVAPVLRGYRSSAQFDHTAAAAGLLAALSALIATSPDIEEIDVNPLIVRPEGLFMADALVIAAGR